MVFKNISGYKFITLNNLEYLKEQLLQECFRIKLKGTILLSKEGINTNVAGTEEAILQLLNYFKSYTEFNDITFKENYSDFIPFKRMVVKIKKEIITLGKPQLDTSQNTSHTLAPAMLKEWLDLDKEVILLDTRNDYEINMGTFQKATQLHLQSFREMKEKIVDFAKHCNDDIPVVMFCTGGIRCEKVLPLLLEQGVSNVFQLEGGILNYFQQCGDAYYQGECFVFDERIAVDAQLNPTQAVLCNQCQMPLTLTQQLSEAYKADEYCPYCK